MNRKKTSTLSSTAKKWRRILLPLLILELLILWIINPSFIPIPFLENNLGKIKNSLVTLLWPQKQSEFFDHSIRYWVYRLCSWVKDMDCYPTPLKHLRLLIPVLFLLTYIIPAFFCLQLSKKFYYGISKLSRHSLMVPCKKVQERCSPIRTEDLGIWFTNIRGKDNNDIFCEWENDMIVLRVPVGEEVKQLVFRKNNGKVDCKYEDNVNWFPMQQGVAIPISYEKLDGGTYHYCTATWLGSYNDEGGY